MFAHELGHRLGLDHTFQYLDKGRCRREPVDRNREYAGITFCGTTKSRKMCEATGDGLSDTPADINDFNPFHCRFDNAGARDHFNDSYFYPPAGSSQPDATNLMTYHTRSTCQTNFTRLQRAVMLTQIEHNILNFNFSQVWKNPRYEFDSFEPDNSRATARQIRRGESQTRNFHYQPGLNGNNLTTCDEDWVRFVSHTSGLTNIFTSGFGNSSATNTILELYNATGTLLASNDDISKDNYYSSIDYNVTAEVVYFLRVRNKNPNHNGYYTLTVGCDVSGMSIQGLERLCREETAVYSLPASSIPPNASIQWITTGNLGVSGSATGTSVSVVSGGQDGYGEVTAKITAPCTNQVTLRPKRVLVGNPTPPHGENMIYGDTPWEPGGYSFSIPMYLDIQNYEWFVSGPQGTPNHSQDGTNYCYVNMDTPGWYYLNVKGTNQCGDIYFDNQTLQVYVPNYSNYNSYYSYSPNPASNELAVYYDDKSEKVKSKKDFSVKLLDNSGRVLREGKNLDAGNKIILNTSELGEGNYFLHIFEGKAVIKKQVLIKH